MDSSSGGQGMSPAGFPHSEICGSRPICGSPQLFAAYHVLHRLLTPRHPPCALSSLTEHSDARWLAFYPSTRIQLSKIASTPDADPSASELCKSILRGVAVVVDAPPRTLTWWR